MIFLCILLYSLNYDFVFLPSYKFKAVTSYKMDLSQIFEVNHNDSMESPGLKLVVKKRKTVTFTEDFSKEYLENKANVQELRLQIKIRNKLDYYLAIYPMGCQAIPPNVAVCEIEILDQLEKDISQLKNKEIKRKFIYDFQSVKFSFLAASALGRKVYGK